MNIENRCSEVLRKQDPGGKLKTVLFSDTKIPSPLILASGALIEKPEQIDPFLEAGVGAVVPRTTRKTMERKRHPSPHLYQIGRRGSEMMLNAEWTGADIGFWRPYLDKVSETQQVIMSVSGRNIEDCVEVCKELDLYNFPYLEINVGCAHSNSINGFITRNSDHIKQLTTSIKDSGVVTPIALKLGHSDFIVNLANVAKEAGADAIVAINTFGPLFDFNIDEKGNPQRVLGITGSQGGMSGAPLFNIALTDVANIKHQVGIPVIGCGGVRTEEHVIKMLMAGASAVQIYTAAHVKGINAPNFFTSLNKKMLKYLDAKGISKIENVKDLALELLDNDTNLNPIVPKVDDNCTGCGKCITICLPEAINDLGNSENNDGKVEIDEEKCVGCGHCVSVCPSDAIAVEKI